MEKGISDESKTAYSEINWFDLHFSTKILWRIDGNARVFYVGLELQISVPVNKSWSIFECRISVKEILKPCISIEIERIH